jgi:hypothetical protein
MRHMVHNVDCAESVRQGITPSVFYDQEQKGKLDWLILPESRIDEPPPTVLRSVHVASAMAIIPLSLRSMKSPDERNTLAMAMSNGLSLASMFHDKIKDMDTFHIFLGDLTRIDATEFQIYLGIAFSRGG